LQAWSDSYAVFARAVPAARIVTAIVSQVVSARALRHPLTRLRRDAADREKLAAAMQILWPPYQAMPARVAFAAPLAADAHSPAELRRAIGATARALIAMPVATWGD
jgi:DNA polymerase III delta subunit